MKKKKGSSLLVTVCMFAILSIIIMSILAMTTAGFKLRKDESKRIENFYGADSGIEIAYAEIQNVILEAIKSGNKLVDDITKDSTVLGPDNQPVDKTKDNWENDIFKKQYEKYIEENLEDAIDNVNAPNISTNPTQIYLKYIREGKEIKVDARRIGTSKTWELISNFTDKENKERQVSVNYDIETPEYGIDAKKIATPADLSILDYIIAVDGNMDLKIRGAFNALGDMWVKGGNLRDEKDSLSSGILIEEMQQGASIAFHGNIATMNTLDIENSNVSTVAERDKHYNIYANDLRYTNNDSKTRLLFPYNTGAVNINLYNDFIFNANNTTVNMNSLYGLSDIDTLGNLEYGNKDELKTSSSIIVNSKDFGTGSKISIKDETVMLGTAYLNLSDNGYINPNPSTWYKSGESIVINRNTSPYTYRNYIKNYEYKYKNKLHMIDKILKEQVYNDLTILEKSNLVKDYFNSTDGDAGLVELKELANGIDLNKVYSAGVMYDQGSIAVNNVNEPERKIAQKKKEYANEVFFMGANKDATVDDFNNKQKAYKTVENSFNWKGIEKLIKGGDILDDENNIIFEKKSNTDLMNQGVAVFKSKKTVKDITGEQNIISDFKVNMILNYSDKDLVVTPTPIEIGKQDENKIYVTLENDSSDGSKTYPTIIISKGGIELIKNYHFWEIYGLFLTTENLSIEGDSMNFGNYATDVTLINRLFKKIFEIGGIGDIIVGDIFDTEKVVISEVSINTNELIKNHKWKLIK